MAIIIPISNIYNIDNQKIRDNIIDRIEIDATQISPNNNYDIQVYNESFYSSPSLLDTNDNKYNVFRKTDDYATIFGYWIGFSNISNIKYYNLSWEVPKLFNNSRIEKISGIKYTVYYNKTVYDSSMSATFYQNDEVLATYSEISKNNEQHTYGNSSNLDFARTYEYSYTPDVGIFSKTDTNKVTLEVTKPNFTNVDEESIIVETADIYQINQLKILGEFEQSLLGAWDYGSIGYPEAKTITLQGQTHKYIAQKIEITIYGNTNGISAENTSVVISAEEGKNPFSINGNELMQTENYYLSDGANYNQINYFYSNTLNQYIRGKETATILCSISDYYDNLGRLAITQNNAQNMVFELYNEVVPMVNNGTPLSLSLNGKAKTFGVLGLQRYYDGAVWQGLSLQEKGEIPYIGGTENLKYEVVNNGNYCRCVGGNEDNSTIEITEFIGFLPNACYVEEIADNAFKNDLNLKEIILPRGIKYIGNLSFGYCQNVEKILYKCKNADLTYIDNAPFWRVGENVGNTVVVISNEVEKIPAYLFASDNEEHYSRINELDFGEWSNCRLIEESAFSYCKDLKLLDAPVDEIGKFAFSDCTGLQIVYLENISVIDRYAFSNCSSLYEIHFGKSLKRISLGAFSGCNNFADIYYEGTFEDWQKVEIEPNNGDADISGSFMDMVTQNNIHYEEF